MKKALLALMVCLAVSISNAQTDTTVFTPIIKQIERSFESSSNDSIYLLFNDQMKKAVAKEQWPVMLSQIKAQVGKLSGFQYLKTEAGLVYYTSEVEKLPMLLHLVFDGDKKIGGIFLRPSDKQVAKPSSSNFIYQSPVGKIYGTLTMPADSSKKIPVVLIIAGSGPTDRNGNSPLGVAANSYGLISDSLKKYGIATLRYDKRLIGESAGINQKQEDVVFENFVDDAAGIIDQLKKDTRFSKVIVLGHSEGSLVGMLAANKTKADAFISVAGAGDYIYNILRRQISSMPQEFSQKAFPLLDSMQKGHRVENVGDDMLMLFDKSLQPFLLSWFKYNPQNEIKKLKIPVLIVQGTTDIQTETADALLLKKAKPNADIQVIKGMNHVLKAAPMDRAENAKTYSDASLPLMPEFVSAIKTFVQKLR